MGENEAFAARRDQSTILKEALWNMSVQERQKGQIVRELDLGTGLDDLVL
jgi:hypothetical protein